MVREAPCPVAAAARRRPDAAAVVDGAGTLTYAALDARIRALVHWLSAHGVASGRRVGLWAPVSADAVAVIWALLRLGAVACPISTRLPVAAGAAHLQMGGAHAVATMGTPPPGWPGPVISLQGDIETVPLTGAPSLDLGRPATVIFTSGSTGAPKAALHALGNHWANAHASNRRIAIGPGGRWLLSLPLYHVGGLGIVFRSFLAGAALAIPEPGEPLDEAIIRYGATHVSLVATQLKRLLEAPAGRQAIQALQAALLGGGPAPHDWTAAAVAAGMTLHTTYGMTETASQLATTGPGTPVDALRTAGPPLILGTVRLAEDGEILVRGATLFLGYITGDGLERPSRGGWFPTGDLGAFDDAGRLVIVGRKDNRFISGGENIHPEEIEAALLACPGVRQALVVPIEDAEFGRRPAAFVDADPVEPAALRTTLASHLPKFKIPVHIWPWPGGMAAPGIKPSRTDFAQRAAILAAPRSP